jgi:hypothetical protein
MKTLVRRGDNWRHNIVELGRGKIGKWPSKVNISFHMFVVEWGMSMKNHSSRHFKTLILPVCLFSLSSKTNLFFAIYFPNGEREGGREGEREGEREHAYERERGEDV